jgi:hypothetical protein
VVELRGEGLCPRGEHTGVLQAQIADGGRQERRPLLPDLDERHSRLRQYDGEGDAGKAGT